MAGKADNSTDRSRKWRAKRIKEGAVPVNFTLLPENDAEALKVWRRLALDHEGPKAVVLYLLRLAAGERALSDDELISTLKARINTYKSGSNAPSDPVRPNAILGQKQPQK